MFEWLSGFWGGVIALASGLIVLLTLKRMLSVRPSVLFFDFFSYLPQRPELLSDIKVRYLVADELQEEVVITEVILKNETGAPISDQSFVSPLIIKFDSGVKILLVRALPSGTMSKVKLDVSKSDSFITTKDVVLPIDGSIRLEIISDIHSSFDIGCVHNSAKIKRRNYSGILWLPKFDLLLTLALIMTLVLMETALRSVGSGIIRDPMRSLFMSLKEFGEVYEVLFMIFPYGLFFVLFFLVRLFLGFLPRTEEERKFSKQKFSVNRGS